MSNTTLIECGKHAVAASTAFAVAGGANHEGYVDTKGTIFVAITTYVITYSFLNFLSKSPKSQTINSATVKTDTDISLSPTTSPSTSQGGGLPLTKLASAQGDLSTSDKTVEESPEIKPPLSLELSPLTEQPIPASQNNIEESPKVKFTLSPESNDPFNTSFDESTEPEDATDDGTRSNASSQNTSLQGTDLFDPYNSDGEDSEVLEDTYFISDELGQG
ncbi:MAG: hypothetical protein H7A40_00470 [Chlamydiales bacterium]|nr:hypothetical protein [Chlamydiales bacterium]